MSAEIMPLLVTPPVNELRLAATMPSLPAEIVPLLLMPPVNEPMPSAKMPILPAEIVPALLMPPVKVGPLTTIALVGEVILLALSMAMP